MAPRSGIEPPSPHRQCGRLIQMRNGAISIFCKDGALERGRTSMVLPGAPSTRCVYRFRHEHMTFRKPAFWRKIFWIGGRGWIRTSVELALVRLRAACRRPLGYSSENRSYPSLNCQAHEDGESLNARLFPTISSGITNTCSFSRSTTKKASTLPRSKCLSLY